MKRTLAFSFAIFFLLISSRAADAQVAIEIGGGYTNQSGHYLAPCGCTFAFGTGYQLMGGLAYDLISIGGLSIGVRPGVSLNQFTSEEVTPDASAKMLNGDKEDIKLLYLNVDPYVRYQFSQTGLFLQVAPSLGYLTSSWFHHIAGAESETDSTFNADTAVSVRSARYSAKLSAGYWFNLGGIQLAPVLTADLPLTDLSIEQATDWKITTIYGSIQVRF